MGLVWSWVYVLLDKVIDILALKPLFLQACFEFSSASDVPFLGEISLFPAVTVILYLILTG